MPFTWIFGSLTLTLQLEAGMACVVEMGLADWDQHTGSTFYEIVSKRTGITYTGAHPPLMVDTLDCIWIDVNASLLILHYGSFLPGTLKKLVDDLHELIRPRIALIVRYLLIQAVALCRAV